MLDELSLIQEAFNNLEEQKERFLKCERAYRAEYKDNNRTSKLKSSEKSQSRLYVPLIKTTINIIHSIFKTSFMSDVCPIEISRVGYRSDNDLILANALSAMLKEKWKSKEHRIGLSKAVLSALYLPLGIVSLYYDSTYRAIRTKFIPITDLAFDKSASDINDIEYVAYRWGQSVREIKEKIKNKKYKQKDTALIYAHNELDSKRVEMKDIYIKTSKDGEVFWRLKSFANGVLVREAKFSTLPFHFGYCIEAMPSIELDERENEIAVYGSCIPEIAAEIQEEYNIKRNQKINIVERQIDPVYIVDKTAGAISISDIVANKKFIRTDTMQGKRVSDLIQPLPPVAAYPLSEEINMLNHEYEIATGVNSVMTGQTSPSDRRASTALQVVNAASSSRIESMIQTLIETMLLGYATHFVELIYKFSSDDEFIKATEDMQIIEKIGTQSERVRNKLDFDIKVNFGTSISKDMRVSQLNSLLGMLGQAGVNSPELAGVIAKEIIGNIMGENAPIEQIDMAINQAKAQQELALAQQQQELVARDQEMMMNEAAQSESTPSEEELEMASLKAGGI